MATLQDRAAPHADRVKAASALASSKDPSASDTLADALGTTDEKLTEAVLASLRALKAAPVLERRLQSDLPEQTKVRAAVALRHLKEPSSVAPLAAALKDPGSAVRKEAALALAVIGPQAAETELIAALADPDGDVRYFAADALGAVKTPRARAAISARIEVEKNPTVQSALGVAGAKQAR